MISTELGAVSVKKPMAGTVTFELPRKSGGGGRLALLSAAREYLPGFNSLSGVILRR